MVKSWFLTRIGHEKSSKDQDQIMIEHDVETSTLGRSSSLMANDHDFSWFLMIKHHDHGWTARSWSHYANTS